MRTGHPKIALVLTDEERGRLDSLAHRSRRAVCFTFYGSRTLAQGRAIT
jgi:hypothetical protein